ncbi:MAG: hypothetical protein ACK5PB_03750 [Pirellula sp.]
MADPRKPTRNAVHREKLCRLTRHRQERLERTADYFLKGNSFRSIAEQTGVSLAQVQRDVALCKREWSKSTSREIQSSVAKELARIDRIEAEAWQAWERSQREQDERIEETTESDEHGTTIKKGKRTKKSVGEAAMLAIPLKCVEMRLRFFEFVSPSNGGNNDDIVIDAVEVVVNNREEAQQMLEFEKFRSIVQR